MSSPATVDCPPLTLVLSFPSLVHFLSSSSTDYLSAVTQAAQRTNHLTVQIRTPPTLSASPWSSLLRRDGPSSSSSSSSSSAPPPPPSPTQLWLPLERALAQCYSTATATFLNSGRVLATVDVVIDEMRGLPLCTPSYQIERWSWSRGSDNDGELGWEGAADGEGEGTKGIYDVAALGGTFDHLHAGHKILLTMACAITQVKLIVGVSDDSLLANKKFAHLLEPIQQRIATVERFVELVRPSIQHDVVPITDVYGPTAHDPTIEALVVSEETRAGGDTINTLRSSRSLSTLSIHVINLVADDASSTANSKIASRAAGDDEVLEHPHQPVKVEPAAKMGSTGIREWISKQEQRGAGESKSKGKSSDGGAA